MTAALPGWRLGRRRLLLLGGAAGVGLAVGGGWMATASPSPAHVLWARFLPSGRLALTNPAIEMGQGARTALARVLAQAADVDWDQVEVHDAPDDDAYGNARFGGRQVTADSSAVLNYAPLLQAAGERLRAAMVVAAARRWGVPTAGLATALGRVLQADGRSLAYADLAADLDLAVDPAPLGLPPPRARWVGVDTPRLDAADKTTGRARFGADLRPAEVPVALLLRGPSHGARPALHDPAAARAVPGVQAVLALDDAVAVVAADTWSALQGRRALAATPGAVSWAEDPAAAAVDSEATLAQWQRLADDPAVPGQVVRQQGDAAQALAQAPRRLGLSLYSRHVAALPMEPLNALVRPRLAGLGADVLASTQAPSLDMRAVARAMKTAPPLIKVQRCLVGGAFGRRVDNSAAGDAARIAKAIGGPVQALWLAEDDLAHGPLRSISALRVDAALDARGRLLAWRHRTVADSTIGRMFPDRFEREGQRDQTMVDGQEHGYACEHQRIEILYRPSGVPNGFVRGVGAGFNVWAIESLIDDLATLAGQDALAFRLAHLPAPRDRRVLDALAEACGWAAGPGTAGRGDGSALGLAFMAFRGSAIAMAARVRQAPAPTSGGPAQAGFEVLELWAAVDCGQAVQPDLVKAQIEGAAVMGAGFALQEAIHLRGGRRWPAGAGEAGLAAGWAGYRAIQPHQAPRVQVQIVAGEPRPPQGVGEIGLPLVAPAIANALVRLGRPRALALPLRPS